MNRRTSTVFQPSGAEQEVCPSLFARFSTALGAALSECQRYRREPERDHRANVMLPSQHINRDKFPHEIGIVRLQSFEYLPSGLR